MKSIFGGRALSRLSVGLAASACAATALAQDATWNSNPPNNVWNSAGNWTPMIVPTGTATFDASTVTSIGFSNPGTTTSIGTLQFNVGAPAYGFSIPSNVGPQQVLVRVTGAGVINNSAARPTFATSPGFSLIFPGSLVFANSSTAGNAVINNSGSLGFLDTSTAGNAAIVNGNLNLGILAFPGSTRFSDASTAGNATITNVGKAFLEFFGTSTAGNATITTGGLNALTTFHDNSSGGQARIIFELGGGVNLSFLTAAVMSVGSLEGPGTFDFGARQLTIGGNDLSTSFSGLAGIGGSLIKVGTGTLTLPLATYTGPTTVDGGTLAVTGSIATSGVTVNSGATLMGTGMISAALINSGGTLAPGTLGTPATFTIQGPLTLANGSLYLVQASPGAIAKTDVTGTATLTGSTALVSFASGAYQPGSYPILTATGGLGGTTFANFNTLGAASITGVTNPHLGYDANNVFLILDQGSVSALLPPGAPANAVNVAGSLDSFVNSGGSLAGTGFFNLFGLPAQERVAALIQLSGEVGASGGVLAATQQMNSFLSLMVNPFVEERTGLAGFGPASAYTAEAPLSPQARAAYAAFDAALADPVRDRRWSAWAAAFGGNAKVDGDVAVGSSDTTARTWGIAAGVDYRLSPTAVVGVAIAGGDANWGISNGLGSGKSDTMQFGAYGIRQFGATYLAAAGAYAWSQMSTERTVTLAGVDQLRADFDAGNFGARIESGHRLLSAANVGITPYASLQVQSLRLPDYSEVPTTGTAQFALTYTSRTATTTRAELGAWLDARLQRGKNHTRLFGRLAYIHDWRSDPAVTATFQGLPAPAFIVTGASVPDDLALVTLGAETRIYESIALAAKFDGEFGSGYHSYAGTGVIRVSW
jgi:autotransporter-associated beta strand protein